MIRIDSSILNHKKIKFTKWQLITHWLVRIISIGLCHGRCRNCGTWMRPEMVAPFCSGVICPRCNNEWNDILEKTQNRLDRIFK